MSKLVIRSDEEAFAWLERYMEGNVDVDGIQFEVSGGFARHELRIYGVKP